MQYCMPLNQQQHVVLLHAAPGAVLFPFQRKYQKPDTSIITENIKLREANKQLTDEKHEILTSMRSLTADNTYLKEKIEKIEKKNSFRDYKPSELEKRLLNMQTDLFDISNAVWNLVSMNLQNMVSKESSFVSSLQIFVLTVLTKIEGNIDGNLATIDMQTRKKIIEKCRQQAFSFSKLSNDDESTETLLVKMGQISVFIQFLHCDPDTNNFLEAYDTITNLFIPELRKTAQDLSTKETIHFMNSLSLCAKVISCHELFAILIESKIFGGKIHRDGEGLTQKDISRLSQILEKMGIESHSIYERLHFK